ncbi:MAG: HAMP domain-containing histidine kinase [Taibaiella sp.]|nr:HAMP domain-containing histidine kinase [Taibaiella sp.]
MKLLNKTLTYISVSIVIIVTIWSAVLYWALLDEIYDSIDDGLANYKLLILHEAQNNPGILNKHDFAESNYSIYQVDASFAITVNDRFSDTLMYMQYENDLEPVRMLTTAFEQDGHYYLLRVIASMVEEDDLIENLFWFVLGLFAILILSFVLINAYWHQKLWQPFYHLLDKLKVIQLDQYEPLPVMDTDVKEFTDLHQALQYLVSNLQASYRLQKQFTENAAHELQTPIAIISSKVELLLEQESIGPEQAAIMTSIYGLLQRMSKLNRSLLTLSRIENQQFRDNKKLSVTQLTGEILDRFREWISQRSLKIIPVLEKDVRLQLDESLALMMIQNLILNAIKYAPQGSEIRVELSRQHLIIENRAEHGALDAQVVFERFYKGKHHQGSTGLGLAIVKAITDLYGFRLSYEYMDGDRHRFSVYFRR